VRAPRFPGGGHRQTRIPRQGRHQLARSTIRVRVAAYTPGAGAQDPETDWIGPVWVVQTRTEPDGVGGTYTLTYHYTGARQSRLRGFEGFTQKQVTDSRNGQIRQTSYDLLFPNTGMVHQDDLFQSDGSTLISHLLASNTYLQLDSRTNLQRYFPFASSVTTDVHEVGDAKNGQLISTTATSYQSPNSYGNFATITETVTDQDTDSPFSQLNWMTTTTPSFTEDGSSNWCIKQPTSVSVAKAVPGQPTITTTTSYTVDYTHCRGTSETISAGDPDYQVTRGLTYDSFGNLTQVAVTGAGMAARTSTTGWGTTGQFPETLQDPVAYAAGYHTRQGYDYGQGVMTSQVVETTDGGIRNAPATTWTYDHFGRIATKVSADGSSATWSYADCTSGCYNTNHRVTVTQTFLDSNSTTISDQINFLDRFERALVTRKRLVDGTYNQVEQQYDAQGRLAKRSLPCSAAGCTPFWVTPSYDAANRVTAISRPQSETVATAQTTQIHYLGRKTTVQDAYARNTTRIVDVTGQLRQSQDDSGYYQSFTYDSLGTITNVSDSHSNQLYSAVYNYGVKAFPKTVADNARGLWHYTYDALGELTAYTDANGQSFASSYDGLSRPVNRRDGVASATSQETLTQWSWGATPALHNVGQLQSASTTTADGTYSDTYSFDGTGRLADRTVTIPSDGSYDYNLAYNAAGLLDTLTYPADAGGYRLALKYCYANGLLQSVADTSCSGTTVFWQVNSVNPRGQITQNTLGNGIATQRHYDAVTAMMTTRTSGPGASPAALQNESYLFDALGNLTQRQNNTLGLTEDFYYDNLYRLDYSTLNNGSSTSTNLDPSYDSLGNILTKVETGGTANPVAQTIRWTSYNYVRSVTASVQTPNDQIATFYYAPDRQRWRMDFAYPAGAETTYNIGGLMEKVVIGGISDYRYYIYGTDGLATIYSRKTSGTNTYRYVLQDHLGSVASLLDSNATAIVSESFTAYGNRREASTWSGPPTAAETATMNAITREGFTGQTVLGDMGLNHMNGRIEDAAAGLFLSADSYVTQPGNTQAFSRYAYVYNNPLSYADPSGFGPCFQPLTTTFQPTLTWDMGLPEVGGSYTSNYGATICLPDLAGPNIPPPNSPGSIAQNIQPLKFNFPQPQGNPCPSASGISNDPNQGSAPFTDDQGNPINDINGNPMQRPAGWDPHYFTQHGALEGLAGGGNLGNFSIGGIWDAQRLGGAVSKPITGFIDFANVNIGLFSSAAGLPQRFVLNVANDFAAVFSNFGNQPRDPTYSSLRAANVYDIRLGYTLQGNGAICTRH
jgi:RHS repeat-associated protein